MQNKPSDSFALQVSREIGQITGQLSSLISTVEMMSTTINGLDSRLRANEKEATKMATMIGSIGILAGGIGSFLMNIMIKK